MTQVRMVVFVVPVNVPGTCEWSKEFARREGWDCEVLPDGGVRVVPARRTSTAPFTVYGVGYSVQTDADVPVKQRKAAA